MKIIVRCKDREDGHLFAKEMDCKVAFHFNGYDFMVHRDPDEPEFGDFHVSEFTTGAMAGYSCIEEWAVNDTKKHLENMDPEYFKKSLDQMRAFIDEHKDEFILV